MREIKFRGRSRKTGEWLVGDLLQVANEVFIAPSDGDWFDFIPWSKNNVFHLPSATYQVIPDTLGQFTGLLDKNGEEIYEGDVVRTLSGFVGYVRYNERFMRYEVAGAGESYDNDRNPDGVPRESWEVLGNIYDNPELLNNH